MPRQAKGMPSRAARGDRELGAIDCRGASWSEEIDGKELRGALGGKRNLKPRGSPVSGYRLPVLLHLLQYGMPIVKWFSSTNIRFRKFESYNLRSELALTASVVLLGLSPTTRAFAAGVCTERAVSENSCS